MGTHNGLFRITVGVNDAVGCLKRDCVRLIWRQILFQAEIATHDGEA